MNDFLLKYAPVGIDISKEKNLFIIGWFISFIYSIFDFFGNYVLAYNSLYSHISGKLILNINAKMPTFRSLINYSFYGFLALAFCMLCLIIFHYSYFWLGSKSIYLMKRLPKKYEIHKRALTLPVTAVLIIFLTAFIIMMLYFLVYMIFTPKVCLIPNQWQNLWRIF